MKELPGVSGDYFSLPDTRENKIEGDIDIQVELWPVVNGIIIQEYPDYFKLIYPG